MIFLAYASPWAGMVYFPDYYSWSVDPNTPYSYEASRLEQIIELTGMVITGILYLFVFILLIKLVSIHL